MTELEKWYDHNRLRVEGMGVEFDLPPEKPLQYIDGKYGRFMFRFIDRGSHTPDIEIIDVVSGDTVDYSFAVKNFDEKSDFDVAIEFILNLSGGSGNEPLN